MNDTEKQVEKSDSSMSESARILEALIFASDDIISTAKLKEILPDNPDAKSIRRIIEEININLQKERHPFEILELGGGYQFRTTPYYQPWVMKLFKDRAVKKLSIQALECLAIIAYKQPITKSQIEAIRGVLSEGAVKTLLERRLINIIGRSEKPGTPLLYGTTQEFLKYFGINKLADLPKIEEFEAMAKEKMEDFIQEELNLMETLKDNIEDDVKTNVIDDIENTSNRDNDPQTEMADTSEDINKSNKSEIG